MTFTASMILDLILAALLVYCFVLGVRRGLILSLCSLLAVLLALGGGWYLATHCAAPLEEKLEPILLETLTAREEANLDESLSDQTGQETDPASGLTGHLSQAMQEQISQSAQDFQAAALASLAASLAAMLAKSILFLVGFLGVLILWLILCHALNLVAKLPGLHFLNKALGGVLGLVKGILLLMIARWALCDLLGWIPEAVAAESRVLPLLDTFSVFSLLGL